MKNHSRLRRHRRRMILVLIVALAAVAWVVYAMVADFRSQPVSYSVERIRPMFDQLCPGDTMRYEVSLSVTQVPVVLEITETWCRTGEAGICARADDDLHRAGARAARGVLHCEPDRTRVRLFSTRRPGRDVACDDRW